MMTNTISAKKLLKKELRKPKFRAEYEKLEEDFSVASELIRLRLKAGLTQAELAKKAHTSQPAIAGLESGRYQNVSLSFLKKVGAVLGALPEVHFKKIKAA